MTACKCTGGVMLRAGALSCSTCHAPILTEVAASLEYTSRSLPDDVRARSTFNLACSRGLVMGAEKRGRVWACSREAWLEYRRAHSSRLVSILSTAKAISLACCTVMTACASVNSRAISEKLYI